MTTEKGCAFSRRELEAAALFGSHGLADASTTAVAALAIGSVGEFNPLMRTLLEAGVGWAVGSMLLVAGLVAVAWPSLADRADIPNWFPIALSVVGLVIAVGNLVAVVHGWSP